MDKRFAYVSTNIKDKGEMNSIRKAFNRLNYIPYINFTDKIIDDIVPEQIKNCDCFVLVISNIDKDDNIDLMKYEYEQAVKYKKEIFIYLKDGTDDDNDFIRSVSRKGNVVNRWENQNELSSEIYIKLKELQKTNKSNNAKGRRTRITLYILSVFLVYFVILIILALLDIRPIKNTDGAILLLVTVIIFVIEFVTSIFTNRKNEPDSEYRNYLINKLQDTQDGNIYTEYTLRSTRNADNSNIERNRDIIALMLKNNDESTEYFSISKEQARASFVMSIVACSVGIVILAGSVFFAFFAKEAEASIISLIGGVVTELIAGTVFWVHNKSAIQLNRYYNALHESEKFLSTISLVDRLSPDKRDEIYIEIIRKQLLNDKNVIKED